ncbi:MAG: hypothetical protein KGY43_05670 [Halodesulfurarchaeum sp.]|nr:hypothetical protein [Halodesulfurarchaeum sp.]
MVGKLARSLAIAVLVILLVVSLGTANITIGVERTVLNGDYVSDSLSEEEAYSVIVDEAQRQLETGETPQEGPTIDELFPKVLTESYVQNQTEANIERAFAYLHGDRKDIYLAINTTPLKDDLAAELANQTLAEQGIADFDQTLAELAESESQFQTVREEFKAEQLQRIQAETEPELSDAELEAAYEDRREDIRTVLVDELETRVAESDHPEALRPVIIDLGTLRIDALMDPDMTYTEFTTELDEHKTTLEETLEELVRDQIDEELPDTMELSEQLGPEERAQLEELRGIVGILDLLVVILPLLTIGIALLIGWVTLTRSSGLFVVGGTVTVTGLLSALGFMGAGPWIESEIGTITTQGDMPAALSELLVALISRTVSVFVTQSWLVVLLGIILIVIGFAIRRALLPIADQSGPDSTPGESVGENASDEGGTASGDDPSVDMAGESEDLEQAAPVEEADEVDGTDEHLDSS